MNSKLWTSALIKFSLLIVASCCNSQHQFHKSCVSFNTVRTVNVESPHRTGNVAGKDVHFLISKYTCDCVSAQILDPKPEVMIQKLILKTKQLHCLYVPMAMHLYLPSHTENSSYLCSVWQWDHHKAKSCWKRPHVTKMFCRVSFTAITIQQTCIRQRPFWF